MYGIIVYDEQHALRSQNKGQIGLPIQSADTTTVSPTPSGSFSTGGFLVDSSHLFPLGIASGHDKTKHTDSCACPEGGA